MVAETLTADNAAATAAVPGSGDAHSVIFNYGTYEIAANVEDGDIF